MQDLGFAFRQLLKKPGFTAAMVLTLALGIGANTAIFSVINTTFLSGLPYPGSERLVFLSERDRDGELSLSYPNYLDWHAQQQVFSALAAYRIEDEKLQTAEMAEQISVAQVSAEFFTVLGVNPVHGRGLAAADDLPGAAPVAWISHQAWQRLFGEEPGLVGRTITLDGQPVTVVGILPTGFRFIRPVDIYRPLGPLAGQLNLLVREDHTGAYALGRLKDGVTLKAAQGQMDVIAERLQREYPKANTSVRVTATPLRERISSGARTQLLLLLGAVGLVLLIACVNVANMLLARSVAREKEMAIRIALGASRARLLRQLLSESFLLAGVGGFLGVWVGLWGVGYAKRLIPWEVQTVSAVGWGVDLRVLLFTGSVTVLTAIGFGLAPAWRLSHTPPNDALKNTLHPIRTVFGRYRLSDLLVSTQVALALVLLVGAGLLLRSLRQLTRVDPGFQPERVLTLRITHPQEQFPIDAFASYQYCERILEAVRNLPEVEAAAFGSSVPFTWHVLMPGFYREGAPIPTSSDELSRANCHYVSTDYFRAMGIPLVRGRVFDGHETQPSLPRGTEVNAESLRTYYRGLVLDGVISRCMAERFWPGEDPLGKRFRFGSPEMELPWIQIVGIVGNTTQQGLERGEEAEFYLALRQLPYPILYLVVRARTDPAQVAASVRAAIGSSAPGEAVFEVKTMAERVADSLQDRRFSMDFYALFAGAALLLAVIGLYGVLAFTVSQRTREMGIRMALGARRSDIMINVLSRGLALIVPGAALGLGGAGAISILLRSQLFGIGRTDPLTYGAAAILLLLAGLLACWLPAQRASRVNPLVALRDE